MHAKIYDSLFEYGKCSSLVKNLIAVMAVLHFLQFIFAVICDEFSMRNVCSVGSHPDAYFSVFIAKRPANKKLICINYVSLNF